MRRQTAAIRVGPSLHPRTRRKERSASRIPADTPRLFHRPVFRVFALLAVSRATEIIGSIQLVVVKVVAGRRRRKRRTLNISSSHPSRLAGASG
jgi:hypothetical protein